MGDPGRRNEGKAEGVSDLDVDGAVGDVVAYPASELSRNSKGGDEAVE